jgi:chemotaxis protein methyltransferase CheR
MTAERGAIADYKPVMDLLRIRTGLSFAPGHDENAVAGICRAMARAGMQDLSPYCDLIEADADALDDLIIELTVGETYFFREPAQFEFIRCEVLPEIRQHRGNEHVIRVWSAGCASGEEAYSLAMLFEREGCSDHAHILATDISRAALAKARQATYSAWSLRGQGAPAAKSYLSLHGDRYVLDDSIRRRVAFEYLNLALDVYPSFATGTWGMDLILCRNVLIYFDTGTIRTVARRIFASLADGGWLILGPSDPLLAEYAPFETKVTNAGVFYRRCGNEQASVTGKRLLLESDNRATPSHDSEPLKLEQSQGASREPLAVNRKWPVVNRDLRPANYGSQIAEPCATKLSDPIAQAQTAFAQAEYRRVALLTRDLTTNAAATALRVRALANFDTAEAERECAEATKRHPLSAELQYLHSVLLLELNRDEEAAQAARRVVYLDRSLAMGHFTLGSILRRMGDLKGAQRSYRNASRLAATRPGDEVIPLSDGDCAGRLRTAAETQLALLDNTARSYDGESRTEQSSFYREIAHGDWGITNEVTQ